MLVSSIKVVIQNLNIDHAYGNSSVGIDIAYANDPVVVNTKFVDCKMRSLQITDSYNPTVEIEATRSNQSGLGYGVVFIGAVTNGTVQIVANDCRHAFTTGGLSTGGLVWGAKIVNSTAHHRMGNTYAFGTHGATGSVGFINSTAIFNLSYQDSAKFLGKWVSGTTYGLDTLVSYNKVLWKSAKTGNVGNDPTEISKTNWTLYNSGSSYGFSLIRGTTIKNCGVIGAAYGAWVVANTAGNADDIHIDGLFVTNGWNAILVNDTVTNSSFNNITLRNTYPKANAAYFVMAIKGGGYLNNVNIGSMSGINVDALNIDNTPSSSIYISTLKGSAIRITGQVNPLQLNIGTYISDYMGSSAIPPFSFTTNTDDSIDIFIGDMIIDNLTTTAITINDPLRTLDIGNIQANSNSAITNFMQVNSSDVLTYLNIGSITNSGSTITNVLDIVAGSTVSNFHLGNIVGAITNKTIILNADSVIFGSGATKFAFPTADGTSNQILKTDGNGDVTWQSDGGTGADTAHFNTIAKTLLLQDSLDTFLHLKDSTLYATQDDINNFLSDSTNFLNDADTTQFRTFSDAKYRGSTDTTHFVDYLKVLGLPDTTGITDDFQLTFDKPNGLIYWKADDGSGADTVHFNTIAKILLLQDSLDAKEETLTNSAGLAAALSDETGTGVVVFGTAPTFTTSITMGSAVLSEAELEILDGATLTTTEINYVGGVTSLIQTQFEGKADTLSYSWGVMDTITVGDLVAYQVESNISIIKVSAYCTTDSVIFNLQERSAPNTAGDSLFASPMIAPAGGRDSTSFSGSGGVNFTKGNYIMPVVTTGFDATRFGITVWYIKQSY